MRTRFESAASDAETACQRWPPSRPFVVAGTLLALATTAIRHLPTAAAHGGSHAANDPHWVLLGALLLGAELVVAGAYLGRNRWSSRPKRAAAVAFIGVAVLAVGLLDLV